MQVSRCRDNVHERHRMVGVGERSDLAAARRHRKAPPAALLTGSHLFSSVMSRQYPSASHHCRA